jgi:hypothetical protein
VKIGKRKKQTKMNKQTNKHTNTNTPKHTHPHTHNTNKHSKRLYGRVIEHSLLVDDVSGFLREKAFEETKDLYSKLHNDKYCDVAPEIKAPRYIHPMFGSVRKKNTFKIK